MRFQPRSRHRVVTVVVAILLGLSACLLAGIPFAAAESPADSISIVSVAPNLAYGLAAGATYDFHVEADYRLASASNAYVGLFVFEGQNDLPAAKSAQAQAVETGSGRASVTVRYTVPVTGVNAVQIIAVMLRDSKNLLAWAATDIVPINPTPGFVLFQAALDAHQSQQYGVTIDLLTQAISLAPAVSPYYVWRADALARSQQYEAALADYNSALVLSPDDLSIVTARGIVRMWLKDWAGAVTDFGSVVDQPTAATGLKASALRGRGISYSALGQQSEAIADYRAYLKFRPQANDRVEVLGWIADLGGN